MLDHTPFYAESGGQLGDRGMISTAGFQMRVDDVQKIGKKLWVHKGVLTGGEVEAGQLVTAAVDPEWRKGATQGHSATHLVHAALREILGTHAVQAGSLNQPGYMRFDYSYPEAPSAQMRAEIEDGGFTHDGNWDTSRHMGNARMAEFRGRITVKKESPKSPNKIDAAVCVIGARMVYRRVLASPEWEARSRRSSFIFYT